jgi:hypothetical protein
VDLPEVRRYRNGDTDQLYVTDALGITLGWAETMFGAIHVQVPGSEARIHQAFEAWAALYPDDDLATHVPGRHVTTLASAWQAEIADIEDEIAQLHATRDAAIYQRDQYIKGTAGEVRVGIELNKLYEWGWGILHSIPVFGGSADIDHLLIGPGGVWTVNSKAHPAVTIRIDGDRMVVGRTRVEYIPKARTEASSARQLLRRAGVNVAVGALIVFDVPRSAEFVLNEQPASPLIYRINNVVRDFRARTGVLTPAEVGQAFAVARRAETWDVNPD